MKNAKIRKYFHCMSRNSLERQNQFGTIVRKFQIVFSAICIFFVRYSNIKMLVAAFIFSRKQSHLISHISLFPLIDIPVIKHTINPRHCVSQLKDKDKSYDTMWYEYPNCTRKIIFYSKMIIHLASKYLHILSVLKNISKNSMHRELRWLCTSIVLCSNTTKRFKLFLITSFVQTK